MENKKYIPHFEALKKSWFNVGQILVPTEWYELGSFRILPEQFKELTEEEYNAIEIVEVPIICAGETIPLPFNKATVNLTEIERKTQEYYSRVK